MKRLAPLVGLLALVLVGCAKTPPEGPAPVTFQLEDYAGTWLRTEKAVAFVAHRPYPRVLVFRAVGGTSPLLTPDHPYGGLRTGVLDPYQTPNWDRPARQPAEVASATGTQVRVVAEVDEESALQNVLDVELGEDVLGRPQLTVTHRLINHGPEPRTMAAWSIASIPNGGVMSVPYVQVFGEENGQPRTVRSVGYFGNADPRHPAFSYGPEQFQLDTAVPQEGGSKVLLTSPSGTITWTGLDGQLLTSTVETQPGLYPEGGYNVTFYRNWSPDDLQWHYTELEHVGPLEQVPPGGAATLLQTLTLQKPAPTTQPG